MKKVVSFILTFVVAVLFLTQGTPIVAADCIPNGECKPLGKTCCSGNSIVVGQNICYFNLRCAESEGNSIIIPKTACEILPNPADQTHCKDCMKTNTKVWTAIGCIDATAIGLVTTLSTLGVGIAGGIAFLLILFGALQIMMSAGNPEKLNAGKELVNAAITGLLLIIFSIFLLQLIGVKILAIPGFK